MGPCVSASLATCHKLAVRTVAVQSTEKNWQRICVPTTKFLKVKPFHYTPRRRLGERTYSSYSFSTSALDGGEMSVSRPGRTLAPGKGPPVTIAQVAGWAPEPVWTQRLEKKSFPLCRGSKLDRPIVRPVARHYSDWATLITRHNICTTDSDPVTTISVCLA
jgi:hypothetical protein